MNWKQWLEHWQMTDLEVDPLFLAKEWQPQEADRKAAWELYVEILTRITTRPLAAKTGEEQHALGSIYSLFPSSREILRRYGRDCLEFAKISILILNQRVRPFTAKWHKLSLEGAFDKEEHRDAFKNDLVPLQASLIQYAKMLGDMAGVEEDLTQLEKV